MALKDSKRTSPERTWVFMDAGDTFIYAYPTLYEALQECWQKAGGKVTVPEIEGSVRSFLKKNPRADLTTQEHFEHYFRALYEHVMSDLSFPGDRHRFIDALWEGWLAGDRFRLFDDAHSALALLREQGFSLGIISNWDQTFDLVLHNLGVQDWFEVKVVSCLVGMAKPDVRMFTHALEQAGCEASDAWYLGDQIEVDIEPAQQCGMKAMGVDYYGKCKHRDSYRVVPSMTAAVCTIFKEEGIEWTF